MVGMEEGFLPHQSSIDEDNIDEERRLAYVGITRAQKELTFTLCKERRQYGELVRPEPSRFLLELPQDDLIREQERKVVSATRRTDAERAKPSGEFESDDGGKTREMIKAGKDASASHPAAYSLMHFQRPVDIALPLAFLSNNLFTQRCWVSQPCGSVKVNSSWLACNVISQDQSRRRLAKMIARRSKRQSCSATRGGTAFC